jgi:predicted DNA-binding protein with PD1-like motif
LNEAQNITTGKGSTGSVFVMKLGPGCDLLKSLEYVANKENIRSAVILTGTGSLRQATIRNVKSFPEKPPITDNNRVYTSKKEPLELLSFNGNLSRKNGEVFIHCHISISSGMEDGRAYGGHLVEGCTVLATCEVILQEIAGLEMNRKIDPVTLVNELEFSK